MLNWTVLCFATLAAIATCHTVVADEEKSVWEWEPDQYPSLPKNPKYCTGNKRNPPTSICDPDEILAPSEAIKLDKLIDHGQNSTACFCEPCPPNQKGLIIKVALLMSIKTWSNFTMDALIPHFGDRVRAKWNLGRKCQHDVLIFVSTTYNKVYISMNTKAERIVGAGEAAEMVKDTSKYFQYNNVYEGLEAIVASLQYRAQKYDPRFDRLGLSQGLLIAIIAAMVSLAVIIVAAWLCIRRDSSRGNKSKNNVPSHSPPRYHKVHQNPIMVTTEA